MKPLVYPETRKGANVPTAVADPQTERITELTLTQKGDIARLDKRATEKIALAEELEEANDSEGADIARIEAEDFQKKAAALRNGEGGPPVDTRDPAAAAEKAQKDAQATSDLAPEEIIVAGIEMPYTDFGGKKPTHGSLKLELGKVQLEAGTAFKKGTMIRFSGVAVIKDVGGTDAHDSTTQQVVDCEQRHIARVTDLQVEVPE